ncbi:MAG: prenyltransferase [Thermoplasmatales archaeon]|nr:prenyltransferase [Thermoplasmatales archaeon]
MKVKPVTAGWYNAFRPWSLHGAVVPIVLGGVVALNHGVFVPWVFVLVLIGGILLQSACNLLNTYGDFKLGIDTEENHPRSPELVTGALEPKSILMAGLACLGLTALIGIPLIWNIGWGILFFGIAGLAFAGTYTVGIAYKYRGLGLVFVFIAMGMLMPLGTYYAMAGKLSLEALLLGLPNAFLITGVLSGNEMRDYHTDLEAGIRTLSGRIGHRAGMALYVFLNTACYPALAVLIIVRVLHPACALAFAALLFWRRLYGNSKEAADGGRPAFMMVPYAFKHNWIFGALLAIGYYVGFAILPGL